MVIMQELINVDIEQKALVEHLSKYLSDIPTILLLVELVVNHKK